MSQTIIAGTRFGSASTGKIINVGLWILQIGAAGMFLMAGFLKLSGNAQLVELFGAIGVGQWFRYLTGTLEVAGAFLLLIPRL
ncbi:MAG TPA: DoxX family protein, partial [Candidatus Binatia bacterium]